MYFSEASWSLVSLCATSQNGRQVSLFYATNLQVAVHLRIKKSRWFCIGIMLIGC